MGYFQFGILTPEEQADEAQLFRESFIQARIGPFQPGNTCLCHVADSERGGVDQFTYSFDSIRITDRSYPFFIHVSNVDPRNTEPYCATSTPRTI